MKNLIYMDIDGTLTGQDGSVPISAQEAIKKTRSLGNLVVLCTGRSKAEITDDILDIGFDGIIGAGGGYIEFNEAVIYHQNMPKKLVDHAVDYFKKHDIGYYLESNQGIFGSDNCVEKISQVSKKLFDLHPELFLNKEDPEPRWFYDILNESTKKAVPMDDINKISFISYDHPFDVMYEYFKDDYEVHHATVFEFGPNSGELGIKNVTKKTAIDRLDEFLGKEYKTLAYGDGLNDLDMFAAVDYSVAMDNAKDALKQVANEITDIAENNGIYESFLRNNLL